MAKHTPTSAQSPTEIHSLNSNYRMRKHHKLLLGPLLVAFCTSLLGCGTSEPWGTVSGTVTLDGKPVKSAIVTFVPEQGRSSSGVTDSYGRYELRHTRDQAGASVGNHTVQIVQESFLPSAPQQPNTTGSGYFGAKPDTPAPAQPVPKNLRANFNRSVQAGANTFDFELNTGTPGVP